MGKATIKKRRQPFRPFFLLVGAVWLHLTPVCLQAQVNSKSNVIVRFHFVAGSDDLVLGNTYQNRWGESFTVQKFRFYIGNLRLASENAVNEVLPGLPYFLVDAGKELSGAIPLTLQEGTYHKLSFTLGVDSVHNVSGAQAGALDPLNDMFWTWRSGYVMAKLEGRSPVSPLQQRIFEYHIGGFQDSNNVLKQIVLPLPGALVIKKETAQEINIFADVKAWFSGAHDLRIADNPACTAPGILARQFADNYAQMFTIQSIYP